VLEIAAANVTTGIRVVSVKRGRDPRDYTLYAFGGAGPLHACLIADELGIGTVLVPRSPGASSAEGLLRADLRVDEVVTDVQRDDTLDVERLRTALGLARDRALRDLEGQGFTRVDCRLDLFLDVRYVGQASELRVPLEASIEELDEQAILASLGRFHRTHELRYGYAYECEEPAEIVNAGLTGTGTLQVDDQVAVKDATSSWLDHATGERVAAIAGKWRAVQLYERPLGATEGSLQGPAIVEQYDSTVVIEPGWSGCQGALGELVIERRNSGD